MSLSLFSTRKSHYGKNMELFYREGHEIVNCEYSSGCSFLIQGSLTWFISVSKKTWVWCIVPTFGILTHQSELQYQPCCFDYTLIFLPSYEHQRNHPCHKSCSVRCSLGPCRNMKGGTHASHPSSFCFSQGPQAPLPWAEGNSRSRGDSRSRSHTRVCKGRTEDISKKHGNIGKLTFS